MSRPRISFPLHAVRWLGPAAALALAPKCVLCVLAYAGLASALGLGGRELCGAPAESPPPWNLVAGIAALAFTALCFPAIHRHQRMRRASR